jgi:hypothetical protein
LAPHLADRLAAATEIASRQCRLHPDFGAYGELRIEGDLCSTDHPVRATLHFEDHSMYESATGHLRPMPRRRVCVDMCIRLDPCVLETCSITFVAD